MAKFNEENFKTLGYYVYRLVDPRDNKTFYVGKGCGNRVFDHVNDELRFSNAVDENDFNEDEMSAKMQTIRDIRNAKRKVKHFIHRFGMTEKEAIEVESALIDTYTELGELTNVQLGHDPERGLISTDDLLEKFNIVEYDEPDNIDYVIVKVKNSTVDDYDNDRYEASRQAWPLSLECVKNIRKIQYVLSATNGIVKEVYKVDEWYPSHIQGRVEFHGKRAENKIRNIFIDKLLPSTYRQKGLASSALYKRQPQPAIDDVSPSSESDMRVGRLAQTAIPRIITDGKVSAYELDKMLTLEYSRKAFNLKFPVLALADSDYERKRYYKSPIVFNSVTYMLCNDWYERSDNNDRPYLEKWIKEHDYNNA